MKLNSLFLVLLMTTTASNWITTIEAAFSQSSRRAFLTTSTAAIILLPNALPVSAAPQIYNTPRGVKYAVLKQGTSKQSAMKGDIVAIEYTGYLADGTVFDATHSEGKKNALMFELGGNVVIEGVNEMVEQMTVGDKVQAIIPPELAFGEKGLCLENGECLIKPKATLVYDITLKRSAIPPP